MAGSRSLTEDEDKKISEVGVMSKNADLPQKGPFARWSWEVSV